MVKDQDFIRSSAYKGNFKRTKFVRSGFLYEQFTLYLKELSFCIEISVAVNFSTFGSFSDLTRRPRWLVLFRVGYYFSKSAVIIVVKEERILNESVWSWIFASMQM